MRARPTYHSLLSSTLFVLIVAMVFSCSETPTGVGGPSSNFKFKVTVKNANGMPSTGIRVSVWNLLSPKLFPGTINVERKASKQTYGTTTITFGAASRFRGSIEVLDLSGSRVANLLPDEVFETGLYRVSWSSQDEAPTGIYEIRFIARQESLRTTLFRDSVYAALYQYDPALTVLGWTSSDGTVETGNAVLFPNLYNTPELNVTQDDPSPLGKFHFTDTVRITLSDTSSHKQVSYDRVLINGPNDFTLYWTPSQTAPASLALSNIVAGHMTAVDTVIPVPIVHDWKLFQNYPNPFN